MKKINWDYVLTLLIKKGLLVWSIWYACNQTTSITKILSYVVGLNLSVNIMLYLFNVLEK